ALPCDVRHPGVQILNVRLDMSCHLFWTHFLHAAAAQWLQCCLTRCVGDVGWFVQESKELLQAGRQYAKEQVIDKLLRWWPLEHVHATTNEMCWEVVKGGRQADSR
ncbi:hypothetical protein HaLaN_19036, partial [Haematococcus lacustris]